MLSKIEYFTKQSVQINSGLQLIDLKQRFPTLHPFRISTDKHLPFTISTDEYVPLKFLMTKYFIMHFHKYI